MRIIYRLLTIIITLFLIGCGSALPTIKPYKIDIQQGNVVTSEMLLKLRPGMTKSQVKFIMGTPLLVDSFRTNRWDYFYQLRKDGKIVKQHRVILDFEDDLLKRVRGDVVPKGQTVEDVAQKLKKEAEAKKAKPETMAPTLDNQAEPLVEPIEAPSAAVTDQTAEEPVTQEQPPSDVPLAEEPVTQEQPPSDVPPSQDGASPAAEPHMLKASETNAVETEAVEPVQTMDEPEIKQVAPVEQVETNTLVTPGAAAESAANTKPVQQEAVIEQVKEPTKEVIAPDSAPLQLPTIPEADNKKRVFRLDHHLDTSKINSSVPEIESTSVESAVTEVVEAEDIAEPEEAPSFFERMLEKIGF